MAPPNEYKALVCILLAGGNDSFNMVVPTQTDQYNDYATSRSNVALTSGELLSLNYTDTQDIWDASINAEWQICLMMEAAIISNIGTLLSR